MRGKIYDALRNTLKRLAQGYADAERAIVAFFKKPRKRRTTCAGSKPKASKNTRRSSRSSMPWRFIRSRLGIDRHDYAELTEKLADETKHARLVMDLLQEISGKKDRAAGSHLAARGSQARQGARQVLQELRHTAAWLGQIEFQRNQRKDEDLERAAITLTEGGGGALYLVCSRLKKAGIEAKIARVFREILLDEVGHKDSGARALGAQIATDRRRAAEIVARCAASGCTCATSSSAFPMSEKEVQALDKRAGSTDTQTKSLMKEVT